MQLMKHIEITKLNPYFEWSVGEIFEVDKDGEIYFECDNVKDFMDSALNVLYIRAEKIIEAGEARWIGEKEKKEIEKEVFEEVLNDLSESI